MRSNFSVMLTEDEEKALQHMAAKAYPNMKKGAKAALVRQWLHEAAKSQGIAIPQKTEYGGDRRGG
jgi:hypothetical protein